MPGHLSPPHIERSKIRAGSGIVVLPPLLFAFRTLHTGQSACAYLTEFWVCPSPMVDMFWPAAGVSTITFGSPGLITAAATRVVVLPTFNSKPAPLQDLLHALFV